jgi:endonuclease YncB( thermonuclease family)
LDQQVAVVAIPGLFPGSRRNLSLEMLRYGWATTYEQSGAEYGQGGKEDFLSIEAEARWRPSLTSAIEFYHADFSSRKKRRGMWKDGIPLETPAEYKKRYAATSAPEKTTGPKIIDKQNEVPSNKRWWKNFWPS